MARYASDGMVRVAFCPEIADMETPTLTELDAGTLLHDFLPKDGLTTPANRNNVDDDALADTFDGQIPGTWGGALEMIAKRDNTNQGDDAWELAEYGLEGFIVVRRGHPAGVAWADGDLVEVYPGTFHQPTMQQTASNTQARFDISFPVRSPGPVVKASVVDDNG